MVIAERPEIYSQIEKLVPDRFGDCQPAYRQADENVSYGQLETDFRQKVKPPQAPGVFKVFEAQINPFDLESSKVPFRIARNFFAGANINPESGVEDVPPAVIRIGNEQLEIVNKVNSNTTRTLKVSLHDDLIPDHMVSESRDNKGTLMSGYSELIDPNKKQVEGVSLRGAIVRMVTRLQNMDRLTLVHDSSVGLRWDEAEALEFSTVDSVRAMVKSAEDSDKKLEKDLRDSIELRIGQTSPQNQGSIGSERRPFFRKFFHLRLSWFTS